MGKGVCHRHQHLGENSQHYMKSKVKDCELKAGLLHLYCKEAPTPWTYGDAPISTFYTESDKQSFRLEDLLDLSYHQHPDLEWLHKVVKPTEVHH